MTRWLLIIFWGVAGLLAIGYAIIFVMSEKSAT